MYANSLKRALTKKLHVVFISALVAGSSMFASVGQVWAGTSVSVFDSLGAATPASQFSITGAGGLAIIDFQNVGPAFSLTQPTTLTEIGGLVNNCQGVFGVPCSGAPLIVQIRPAINGNPGVPDPNTVLASFVLSNDNQLLIISYESVSPNLPLPPGHYFALFVPQNGDFGIFLGSALNPFFYSAPLILMGVLDPLTGNSRLTAQTGAARILGNTNVFIDGCNSGVTDVVLPSGSTISELITECADSATNHGRFVACIADLSDDLKKAGTITAQEQRSIHRCAARANTP